MKRLRMLLGLAALAIVSVALVACNGDDDTEGNGNGVPGTATPANGVDNGNGNGEASTVEVALNEWDVIPDPGSVPAGEVTFTAQNTGALPHELVVVRADGTGDGDLPVENSVADLSGVETLGDTNEFPAGESRELTVNLEPGEYILLCNVPAHYPSGMHTSFTVE